MKNNDKKKTKEQLLNELKQLRRRINELETLESNQKKVGEVQYENEEKYREFADNINDVFFAMDKDLRYTYWNKASEKLTGIAMKDAIGKSIFEIFPDSEDTRRAVSVYREVLNRRQSKNFVNEYHLRGKTYFFEISAYPSKNGISVFAKDITERKKTEEALQESEQRYRTLYESNKDGIAGGDMEGNILECNQAFADMLGYTKEEIKKITYQELTPKKWHKIEEDIVKNQIIARGYSDEYEKEYIRKDGTIFPISCKVWLRKDEKGEVVGMWGIVRDITEHKKAEEVIRESEERLRLLIESAEDVILMQDIEGKYLYYNGPPKYGIKPGEVIGKTPFDFHSPENAAKFMGEMEKVVKSGKSVTYESIMNWQGEKLWFIDQMSPIKDSAGNVKGVVTISRNITERKKAEEELAEYRKQLHQSERLAATGRLAASIAHEINNPLQAISFNLDFVKSTVLDDFKEKRSIEQVEIGTKRIKNTVKQLLDIHRGKVETKEIVNVNNIIEATLNLLKNQLMINKIEVKKSLSTNIPLITGITQELYQIFMNLIMNAQDAMEKGGILNIITDVKDNKLRIIFEDNGCGISEEDMGHIFEPFFTTKSAILGTGLGLSISKGIIESFGGNIDVKSTIGKGSSFTITFPIHKQKVMVNDHG